MITALALGSMVDAVTAESTPPLDTFSWVSWGRLLPAILTVVLGGIALAVLSSWIGKRIGRHWSNARGAVTKKFVLYAGWIVLLLTVFNQLGFKLTAVLGAAGVIGIAVGFAAQTSLSNVISGVFLTAEKPFRAGDMIQIGETMGLVLSIDLLSVKLRTFDNRFVRIPNENVIKAQVINISRHPIRRVDLTIGIAYREDVDRVKTLLLSIAREQPLALNEPEPLCFCTNFNSSSVDLLFVVWAVSSDFLKLKDALLTTIKKHFDQEDIEIPFPHLSLYQGSESKPLQLELSADTLGALTAAGKGPLAGPAKTNTD